MMKPFKILREKMSKESQEASIIKTNKMLAEIAMLKPCPFCGAENPKISCDDFGWLQFKIRNEAWWIQCQEKHCYGLQQGSTKEKVIERWNKRNDR